MQRGRGRLLVSTRSKGGQPKPVTAAFCQRKLDEMTCDVRIDIDRLASNSAQRNLLFRRQSPGAQGTLRLLGCERERGTLEICRRSLSRRRSNGRPTIRALRTCVTDVASEMRQRLLRAWFLALGNTAPLGLAGDPLSVLKADRPPRAHRQCRDDLVRAVAIA